MNLEEKYWLHRDFVVELLKQLPIHVFWKNKNSVYLGCNDLFAHSLGLRSPEEIIGKTDYDLPTTREESDAYRLDDQSVMASRQSKLNIEEPQTLPDGKKVVLLTSKVPLLDSNSRVMGVLGMYTDITERKEMEESLRNALEKAETASKAKTEFLENMRHDIRTPLTGIIGWANMIAEEINNPKIKEKTKNLIVSCQALQDLLNEILEVIKIGSNDLPIAKKKFDLKEKLLSIIDLNRAKALQKKIDLLFEYDPNIPKYLLGDSIRIHRIVLELITNALNFTKRGYVKLSVQLAKKKSKRVIVKLFVEDTGIGIPDDKKEELFLQFKRLNPSYQGLYKGAGLGLNIIKYFIEQIDGEIYVESKESVGSRFTCLFPLKYPLLEDNLGITEFEKPFEATPLPEYALIYPASPVVPLSYPPPLQKNLKNPIRILIIEDHPLAAKVAENILSKFNCQIEIAPNGNTALNIFKNKSYDLILLDIGLPDIDGYELTKQLRTIQFNKNKLIPIIALTAHVDDENKERCIESGINTIITKPLNKEKVEEILSAFISS